MPVPFITLNSIFKLKMKFTGLNYKYSLISHSTALKKNIYPRTKYKTKISRQIYFILGNNTDLTAIYTQPTRTKARV